VLAISLAPVDPTDSIVPALDELGLGPDAVELDFEPTLPPVLADPVLLQRVIVNLLANASRYAPVGTRVRITTSAFGGTAEIRVIDHGPGIPPGRRDDVFAPFQRQGDTDNSAGLGLGLALSKGFVEGMGGTLAPEDTPGGGLTMVVAIPLAGVSRSSDEAHGLDRRTE
jgi:two-component system sensor histidine kinase KdpD